MDILSKFSDTLENLMFERGLNEIQLAQTLGMGNSSISRYLLAEKLPSLGNFIKIADYFNCTADYLLGKENENYPTKFYEPPVFSEQLKYLKKQFGCPWCRFYQTAKISKSNFYLWKKGSVNPSLDSILALAEGFERTADFIIGRTK